MNSLPQLSSSRTLSRPGGQTIGTPTRELSRSKRERAFQHYSKVVSMLWCAFDAPSRDFATDLISALGFETPEDKWVRLPDEQLLKGTRCFAGVERPGPKRDEEITILTNRELENIRKARQRLLKWQDQPGKPLLVEYRRFYDSAEQKHYSEYKLLITELIRDIVGVCPIGSSSQKLRNTVERDVDTYIKCFAGSSKRPVRKRQHSPESDLARAATVARNAYQRELEKSGEASALRAFQKAFRQKFGDSFQISFEGKPLPDQDLTSDPTGTNVPVPCQPKGEKDHVGILRREDTAKEAEEFDENFAALVNFFAEMRERGPDTSVNSEPPPPRQSVPADLEYNALQEGSCDSAQQGLVSSHDCAPLHRAETENAPPVILQEESNRVADYSATLLNEVNVANQDEPLPEYDSDGHSHHSDALCAFLSVGAHPVKAMFKDDAANQAVWTRDYAEWEAFSDEVSDLLKRAEEQGLSFIVRLGGPVIQIDDCDVRTVRALSSLSFLVVETSPQNYQCWLALAGSEQGSDLDAVRQRIFAGLRKQGLNGNGGSYGAVRWPDSINFKPERVGPDGSPRVRVTAVSLMRQVGLDDLAGLDLLPELPADRPAVTPPVVRRFPGRQKWPDYGKCLIAAQQRWPDKESIRSEADAQFVYISLKRGFSGAEIAAMLVTVSEKAEKEGKRYIDRTIRRVRGWLGQ
jgi:hypothetical protein